jgi:hypothetical protein
MLAEVIDIEDYARHTAVSKSETADAIISAAISATASASAIASAIASATMATSATIDNFITKPRIPLSELYPLTHELKPELGAAISLLEEGINHIDVAINMIIENDIISSDDAIQRFQALLPELFCCRNLGDGFGAIVTSIFNSLTNLEGVPANLEQLEVIRKITARILTEPFIVFDEAVDEIMLFEKVGLISESSHFEFIADLLIE